MPARLNDDQLADARKVATMPLARLPAASPLELSERLLMLTSALPKQAAGEIDGQLRVAAYELVLGDLPIEQIDFMTRTALETCRWLPSPAECLEIAKRWRRADASVAVRQVAEGMARREADARLEDARAMLRRGDMDQATIDALPERWQRIFETQGLLTRCECGSYAPRRRGPPPALAGADCDPVDRLATRFPSNR